MTTTGSLAIVLAHAVSGASGSVHKVISTKNLLLLLILHRTRKREEGRIKKTPLDTTNYYLPRYVCTSVWVGI